jgi:hypothetical protein
MSAAELEHVELASVKAEQQEADEPTTKAVVIRGVAPQKADARLEANRATEMQRRPCSRRWQSQFRSECASLKIGIGSLFVQLLTS